MKAHHRLTSRRLQVAALTAFAASASPQLRGQGTVNFSNAGIANSFVYDDRFGTEVKAPVGTTFSVALYWSPQVAGVSTPPDPSTFQQVGLTGHISTFPGEYFVGVVTIAGINPPGGLAWFQVKAWETACGSTYEQAYNRGETALGTSSVIEIRTGDPTTGGSPALLTVIGSIHILGPLGPPFGDPCVPEPSPIVLGLLGAIVVFGFSRHKRSG